MSALFGLLGSFGELVGGEAAAASGSAFVGDLATQAANSVVAQAVDSATSSIVDALFGQNAYENKKRDFYNSVADAQALGLLTGDVSSESQILQKIKDSNLSHSDIHVQVHNFARDFSEGVAVQGLDLAVPLEQNSGLGDLLAKLSQSNPVYYYLVNKLLDKTGELVVPTDASYQSVAAVYNGAGLYDQFTKEAFDGTNTVFSIVDEVGVLREWKYPEYNRYTVIPPLWGYWTGINSPNNQTPLRALVGGQIRESYLDKIAMMHDIDYHDLGSFSLLADQKLIARAANGKNLFVIPGEDLVANVAINYFSTLGAVMRKMLGPVGTDSVVKDLYEDVYEAPMPEEIYQEFVESRPVETDLQFIFDSIDVEYD